MIHAYTMTPNAYQIDLALAYYQLGYDCCGYYVQNPVPLYQYSSCLLCRFDGRFCHVHSSLVSCQMQAAAP